MNLEKKIASAEQRLVVVAPPGATVPRSFANILADDSRHDDLIREVQRLRGSVYLGDGALKPEELTSDGRHVTPEDAHSWHLVVLNKQNDVAACIWYLEHENTTSVQRLRVRACPLTREVMWKDKVKTALESELKLAREQRIRYAEVGGWAVSNESRSTPEGLLLILATFSLSRLLGGALGVSTATVRHSSAAILRRLGLSPLVANGIEVPPYFDPNYQCEMELLRFDTRRSSPRYDGIVEQLKYRLSAVPVVGCGSPEFVTAPAPLVHAAA